MIGGVIVKPLKLIPDDRGFLMEMLRADDPVFERFGQVYITGCKEGVAKAWHYHKEQTDHFVCVSGKALVVLYDERRDSPTHGEVNEFILEDPHARNATPFWSRSLRAWYTGLPRATAPKLESSTFRPCRIATRTRTSTDMRGIAQRSRTRGWPPS